MDALLTALIVWLSFNTNLPATTELPDVIFLEPAAITSLRFGLPPLQPGLGVAESGNREVVSVYDTRRRAIVLRRRWKADTPAELSVLVHEMVHHLQAMSGARYSCPAEREAQAYEAQDKWLKLFGTNLEREFEIDPLTLLVTTHCNL